MKNFAATLQEVKSAGRVTMLVPADDAHAERIAYDVARTLHRFRALESSGFVRLEAVPDEDFDGTDVCDCGDEDCDAQRAYEQDSAWGSVGSYTIDQDSDVWVTADSVWGHVGYRDVLDWRENDDIIGIMQTTVEAFHDANQTRAAGACLTCHGTGRKTS